MNITSDRLYSLLKGKKHIIWDWNGTLLNDVDHAVQVMNSLLFENGLPTLNKDRYRQIFEFPVINYYRSLGFNFEKESFESLCHKFVVRFMSGFRSLPLFPNIKEVLFKLLYEGYTQSVLSATDQENLEAMVTYFKLDHIFFKVFGIDNKLAASKVDRGHDLIKASNFEKKLTVIIGDTLHDLEVGRELGVEVILVGHGHQCFKKLKQHFDNVI